MKKILLLMACFLGFLTANAGVADLETMSSDKNSNYIDRTSTEGWVAKNAAIFTNSAHNFIDEGFSAVCLNGKTTAVGSLTSPVLSNGVGTLSLCYGLPFSDTKINCTINIKVDGATVATTDFVNTSATKATKYEFSHEFNIAGNFVIEIVNNSPSNNSSSNKDRTAIWNVAWTEYTSNPGEPTLVSPELEYETKNFEVTSSAAFTAPTLVNPYNVAVSYSSSDEAIATVAADGTVTLTGALGKTTITAESEQDATYYAGKASYTITVIASVANIAEFIALCTTKDYPTVVINNPVTVVYQNGSRLYVKDESGYLQVYGYNLPAYNQGDVIPAGIKGSAQMYYDVPELSSPVVSTFGDATGTEVVEPIEVNYTDLTIADVNKYILIKGVKVEGTTMTDAEGNTINYKDQFGVLEEGADLDMVAIVNVSYEAVQIYPVKFTSDLLGITDIELNNNAPVQYFNLQGVEVANPENGLYIRRQGNNVTKVIVK